MCIAIISTAHPNYRLILINNRDEFLNRPTAPVDYWDPPNGHVLGGRDLLRDTKGTWLGVTKDGRVAVLTNFHEEDPNAAQGLTSRGAMVNAYLTPSANDVPNTQTFVESLIAGTAARGTGGFSLVCGKIGEDLAVVSNRTKNIDEINWIRRKGETVALSNAAFTDKGWPKVTEGENRMRSLILQDAQRELKKEELINELFLILSETDVIDPEKPPKQLREWTRRQIFFPPFHLNSETREGRESFKWKNRMVSPDETESTDLYGTMKQTVLLVDMSGLVTYVEKTWRPRVLSNRLTSSIEKVRRYEFKLPGEAHKKEEPISDAASSTAGYTEP